MNRYRRKFFVLALCCLGIFLTACTDVQTESGASSVKEIAEETEKERNTEKEERKTEEENRKEEEKKIEKEQETEVPKELTEEEKLEIKYKKFDYEGYVQGEDISGWTEQDYKEVRQAVEDSLGGEAYQVWYLENGDMVDDTMQFMMDAFTMDGKDYGLLWYDWGSGESSFGYYFLDDPEETCSAKIIHGNAFREIEVNDMFELYLENSQSYFANYTNEKLAECNEKLNEYYQQRASSYTKEEVYAVAQHDLKDALNSQMDFGERMIMAASMTWTFDSVDSISYWYDPASRVHALQFTVGISEYMGVGESMYQTVSMQYMEDENGTLTLLTMDNM